MACRYAIVVCLSAVFLAQGKDRPFDKILFESPNETVRAEFWYRISFEVKSFDQGGVESPSHIFALRSLRTCLRLDQSSASCHTQIGALMANSPNAREQLLALPSFKRAAQLNPSVRLVFSHARRVAQASVQP
jgi:hypothetical protein